MGGGRRLAHLCPTRRVMPEQERRTNLSWILVFIYLGLAAIVFYAGFNNDSVLAKHVSYSDFLAAIQDGELETVRVTNSDLIGTLKKTDKAAPTASIATPRLPATDEAGLMKDLRDDHVQIIAEP